MPLIAIRDPTLGNRRASIHRLLATLLSGLVGYRLGTYGGGYTSPPWLANIQNQATTGSSSFVPAVKIDSGHSTDGPDSPEYYSSSKSNLTSPNVRTRSSSRIISGPMNDRRTIPRTSLPYDCGVVFFYHIPSTGGASIKRWLARFERPEFGKVSFYEHWEKALKDGSFHTDPLGCEADFAEGMSEHIQNLGSNEWRIAHSHLMSTYLNESEDLLHEWRSVVEAQGCQLINAVMLRDPLNHAMSLYKVIRSKNSTRDEWTKYLSSPTGTGRWATVLDFFLYNLHGLRYQGGYPNGPGGRNPFNVTKESKVVRAMELLHRHFDIVSLGDHDAFMGKILDWTGWTRANIYKRMNIYKRELEFTKKEVEKLQNLLRENGDLDFIDQAKVEYHGYLSYLTN